MIWLARKHATAQGIVEYHIPYFEELIATGGNTPERALPRDIGAHALWYYYCLASKAIKIEKDCLVLETDLSPRFRPQKEARQLAESVAQMYGFGLYGMTRYWSAVEAQRRALGLTQNAELPPAYKFRFS